MMMDKKYKNSFSFSYNNYLFWALAVIAPICIKIVLNSFINECAAALLSHKESITDLVELNRRFAESGLGVMSTGIASFCVILIMIWMLNGDEKNNIGGAWYGLHKIKATQVVILLISAIVLALSMNLIVNIIMERYSQSYETTERVLFSGTLILRLFVLGIIVPFCEEYIFRGVVFKRLTIQVKTMPAIIISAILFGFYHGNVLQGVYAALMGVILGLLYVKYENLTASIVFHAAANIVVIVFECLFIG